MLRSAATKVAAIFDHGGATGGVGCNRCFGDDNGVVHDVSYSGQWIGIGDDWVEADMLRIGRSIFSEKHHWHYHILC